MNNRNIKNIHHKTDTACYNDSVDIKSASLFDNLGTGKNEVRTPSLEKAKWLTTKEAAQYLRVSVSSLKMMIYRGQVKVRKLGRRNRFLVSELDRLIEFP